MFIMDMLSRSVSRCSFVLQYPVSRCFRILFSFKIWLISFAFSISRIDPLHFYFKVRINHALFVYHSSVTLLFSVASRSFFTFSEAFRSSDLLSFRNIRIWKLFVRHTLVHIRIYFSIKCMKLRIFYSILFVICLCAGAHCFIFGLSVSFTLCPFYRTFMYFMYYKPYFNSFFSVKHLLTLFIFSKLFALLKSCLLYF